jgi:hypothetical protein
LSTRRSCGNLHIHISITAIVPIPPISADGTAPSHGRDRAGAEFAERARRAREHRVDRHHPAQHVVRGAHLHQRLADDHADGVARAVDHERQERQPDRRRQAEQEARDSEQSDRGEHDVAGTAGDGAVREHDRYAERADGGRRSQQPERPGSGVQDVARVDRQQRGDAAEQNREQIERYGAEKNRMAANIGKAGKHRFQA